MLINYSDKTVAGSGISSEILRIATECDKAHAKILHDSELNPYTYAIGFGNKKNSSVIVGGLNENDTLTSGLLVCFAKALACATSTDSCMLGIDVNEIFKRKGIWIIPKFCEVKSPSTAMNFILDKLNPRQLYELSPYGETVSYYSPKQSLKNTRLFAYLLAVSCDYYIDNSKLQENSLCEWFSSQAGRPAYSIKAGRESDLSSDSFHTSFNRILESLLLFTTY